MYDFTNVTCRLIVDILVRCWTGIQVHVPWIQRMDTWELLGLCTGIQHVHYLQAIQFVNCLMSDTFILGCIIPDGVFICNRIKVGSVKINHMVLSAVFKGFIADVLIHNLGELTHTVYNI